MQYLQLKVVAYLQELHGWREATGDAERYPVEWPYYYGTNRGAEIEKESRLHASLIRLADLHRHGLLRAIVLGIEQCASVLIIVDRALNKALMQDWQYAHDYVRWWHQNSRPSYKERPRVREGGVDRRAFISFIDGVQARVALGNHLARPAIDSFLTKTIPEAFNRQTIM